MSGARDLDGATARHERQEALRAFTGEDRALRTTYEQGRASDAANVRPESLDAPRTRRDVGIELVAPPAVRAGAHRIAQALADIVERAARIERVCHRDGVVERGELLYRELLRDRVATLGRHRR